MIYYSVLITKILGKHMALQQFIEIVLHKWKWVLLSVFIGLLIGLMTALIIPGKYKASQELLIVQSQVSGMDLYTAAKTTEYVGNVLQEVIKSRSFYDQIIKTNTQINRAYFKQDARDLKKQWNKMIKSQVVSSTGIVKIDIYHTQSQQAYLIAKTVGDVLTQSGNIYIGGTYSEVQIIDAPILSKYPADPNIIIYTFAGGFFSFLLILTTIYLISPSSRNTTLF